MNISKIKSYCKINLFLKVVKKLNTGYHNISSLITFCDLHDIIIISEATGSKDEISFTGKFKKGIDNKKNTVVRMLSLLRKKNLLKKYYFKINIEKNIPHGSGLGGGSSNAAHLLSYINIKKKLKLKKKKIIELANQIGFDVPINLEIKNTFLTGKKNKILRINKKFGLNLLIIYPNIICSTKKIFENNRKISPLKIQNFLLFKKKRELISFLKKENNDLEKVVVKLYPKIEQIINYIRCQKGCYFSRITGSGSACIGIFSNTKNAIYAQKLLKLKYPKYWSVVSKTI